MSVDCDRSSEITPDSLIPDVIRRNPLARSVFDRYGLRGCGGRTGPVESIRFFAQTHGVDEGRLLAELSRAGCTPSAGDAVGLSVSNPAPQAIDTIYRRFWTAGILLVLTAGATWGAWLLWRIGVIGSFTEIPVFDVNAHGHAQVFGWVGLFIMGFAYQAFPRMWHADLAAARLAFGVFVLMLVGLVVSTTTMALADHWRGAAPAAMFGGVLELVAVVVFAGQIVTTFRRSGKAVEPYVGFVFAALGWFVLMAVASLWHTWSTMTASTRDELVWYVATYQGPLRDLQIHGLALFMILGVSGRMLSPLFGVPVSSPRRAWIGLGLLSAALLAEMSLFIVYRFTGKHGWAAGVWGAWVMLAVGVVVVAWPWRLWRPMPEVDGRADRSGKFVRAAYGWLALSLVLLLLLPAHQWISGIAFSHAYYGAIRHAITVGFVSLMIMAIAAKVVPTLNGVDPRTLSALWGPFVLMNLGCALRVVMQTLTDFVPGVFAWIGVSGVLEVSGLAWWGIGLIRIMQRGKRESVVEAGPIAKRPNQIEPEHRVADVLAWFPATESVFRQFGFAAIGNPILRRTLARQVTLRQAASLRDVPLPGLLEALNQTAGNAGANDGGDSDTREKAPAASLGR